MPTFAELNQTSPCLDRDEVADLRALYSGGKALRERLHRFMPQRPREVPERYAARKNEFHYRNYLGAIIDYFAAMLFTSKPTATAKSGTASVATPDPYYAKFREDCDRRGGDVDAFFKARITDAMVTRRAWFSVEQPSDQGTPATDRAAYERRGLGDCWLRSFEHDAILDWELDDAGNLAWVLAHSKTARRDGLSSKRSTITETWEHYLPERVDTYAITYDKGAPPAAEADVPLVGTRAHRFGRVPLLCLEMPEALWAAERLQTPQLAHLRAINGQSWSLSTTCYAMPVANVKDVEAFLASKVTHGAGYAITLGIGESWGWEAPPTDHFAALDTEIKAHKDEIFRIAHQMALGVENNASAVGRTAASKEQDAQSTRVILTAYGRVVKEAIELVYDMISRVRGDGLTWSVGGLDDFAGIGTHGLIGIKQALQDAGGIPSKTFNADLNYKLAGAVLSDADETRKQTYKQEIEANTPDPADDPLAQLERLLDGAHDDGARSGGGADAKAPAGGRSGRAPAPTASA